MKAIPKTIQIFLPGGDPRGIRIAEITTRIVQVIEVPRSLLQEFLKMDEANLVAVYFLFGDSEEDGEPKVYIGQTGDLKKRLAKHNQEKDFWQRALVLVSKTASLTQTHALYLEWHCIQATRQAGRYADENGTGGTRPYTPAPLQADCVEIFETGRTLLSTLGYPVFDEVSSGSTSPESKELFYCTVSGIEGKGLFLPDGFVVLKGSKGTRKKNQKSASESNKRFRQKLLDSGVLHDDGNHLVFTKDHLFGSPSMAAIALIGRPANGWKDWKDKNGKTLDELKRQAPEATE